jgi:hypothetical protein
MRHLPLIPLALVLAGCPEVDQITITFDMEANTGTTTYRGIHTDKPDEALVGFASVVEGYLAGDALNKQHPGWTFTSKDLVEREGRLDGLARFTFEDAASAGIYKHDKKSPWIYCGDSGDVTLTTNGTDIGAVLPGCVAWDRKMVVLELTIRPSGVGADQQTPPNNAMVEQFQAWTAAGAPTDIENADFFAPARAAAAAAEEPTPPPTPPPEPAESPEPPDGAAPSP